MWEYCGMERTEERLRKALERIPELREEFWSNVKVSGSGEELNQALEKAGRVADFFELAELMCLDALHRTESCGGHFRAESQTPDGEALRDDEQLRLRRGLGVRGDGEQPGPAQGSRSSYEYVKLTPAELQVMNLTLKVWRQSGPQDKGRMVTYEVEDVSPDMSFLEMLDVLNERLILEGEDPIAFDHDCREGICGMCGMVINGVAARPEQGPPPPASCTCATSRTATTITIEPWRAAPFPVVKDLVVDRSRVRPDHPGRRLHLRRRPAPRPTRTAIPVPKDDADAAFDAATCIGCGACVAACPNGSASLFTAAKITHLGLLPQGQPER